MRSAVANPVQVLVVLARGRDNLCLAAVPEPPLGQPLRASDRWELRAPGTGNRAYGRILGFSTNVHGVHHGCSVEIRFRVEKKLGRFSIFDATNGGIWYGFDSRKLVKRGWKVTVIEEGAKHS